MGDKPDYLKYDGRREEPPYVTDDCEPDNPQHNNLVELLMGAITDYELSTKNPTYRETYEKIIEVIEPVIREKVLETVANMPDPYPLDMCSIENDKQYAALIPEPKLRTCVSWYLMGEARRRMKTHVLEEIKQLGDE